MGMSVSLYRKLQTVTPDLREVLLSLFEEVERNREESVSKKEFVELKAVVRELADAQLKTDKQLSVLTSKVEDLAEAQKRTEVRLEELAEAQKRTEVRLGELAEAQKRTEIRLDALTGKVEELAEAQRRTEVRLEELAEAQKRTEVRLEELAEAQKRTEIRLDALTGKVGELAEAQRRTEVRLDALAGKVEELAEAQTRTEKEVASLARGLKGTREQLGGLSKSMAYALENEAYRKLPAYLASVHGIRVRERIVRADVADEEINFFARAEKDGKPVILVGESVLRLDDASKLKSLLDKVEKVGSVYGDELVPILVTHFAKPKVLEKARQAGICVVQSFEWNDNP
uniref:Uncharacterized protein n=1 Tax=Desulfacinum infernum TaxID=35837 RepID=A0A831ZQF8_9BACT